MDPPANSSSSDPARPASAPARLPFLGLLAGAVALVAFCVQVALDSHHPLLILGINLGLAAGAYGALLLDEPRLRDAGDLGILQFLGFMAMALLGRVWLGQTAQGVAILFEYSLSLAALSIAIAWVLFRASCSRVPTRRAALATGLVGGAAFLTLAIALLATPSTPPASNLLLLGLTCIIVVSLLSTQWLLARRVARGPARTLATPLALALAGTQLFDGVLTYLVVLDPLGMAPQGFEEQIPVSRIILDVFGVGFPIVKWALGLAVAVILAQARVNASTNRLVLYLAILAAGMGPGLYSAAQLF